MTDINQKLIEWVENLGNLAATELPAFVHEVCLYGIISNSLWATSLFIASIALCYFTYRLYQHAKEELFFVYFINTMILSLLLFFTVFSISHAVKAAYAPRLYVIERLKE